MKHYLILKLDTPCTTIESAMRVPQAEPINFAKAIIDAGATVGEQVTVSLLGISTQSMSYGQSGTIRILPYFGQPNSIKSYLGQADEKTEVIIWQGMHIISAPMLEGPNDLEAKLQLTDPYAADCYARLSMCKMWQVMMYNLASSSVLEGLPMYFLTTDARLPLLDLNKVNPAIVKEPLPKGIKMLTQAHQATQFMRWHNKYGNAQNYNECCLPDYVYQFEEVAYLPMHALPIWSHSKHRKDFAKKQNKRAIFQVQSLKYMDEFRKSSLQKTIDLVQGRCTLHGRFLAAERAIALTMLSNYTDNLQGYIIDNSASAESFHDAAKKLADYQASLIITDQRYMRYGLCPNRFVEALAVGTLPVGNGSVVQYCDDTLKEAWMECATAEPFDEHGDFKEVDKDMFEQQVVQIKNSLINALGDLVNNSLFNKQKKN